MQRNEERIKSEVKKRYTAALERSSGCCGSGSSCQPPADRVVALGGYGQPELSRVPADAVQSSFGCGNPVAFADLQRGDIVVDIGSGAGLDCLLAAEKVGDAGRVIGVDMTPAMLERARKNAQRAGSSNVEFRMGDAENMPVSNEEADCIISNCVINLSPNKRRVFQEAYRALKPGGRVSVTDIMVEHLPWILKRSTRLYTSCVAGAIPERQYLDGLREAGFEDVYVAERLYYDTEQLVGLLGGAVGGWIPPKLAQVLVNRYVNGKVWSARVHARKPLAGAVH